MGFLDLFKKKQKEEPKPAENTNVEQQGGMTTKSMDEKATFEIPDFSEEDLDFDLGLDDFLPEGKEEETEFDELKEGLDEKVEEIPEEDDSQKELRDQFNFDEIPTADVEEQKGGDEKEEIDEDFTFDELPEELPVFETKEEHIELKEVTKPVYLEKQPFMRVLSLSKQITEDVKDEITIMKNADSTNETEMKIYEDMAKNYDDMQHSLLYIDEKLFG